MKPREGEIPTETGCLSVLLDAGEVVRVPEHLSKIKLKCGAIVPVVGGIGMTRPQRWAHTLWLGGVVYRAELLCDVPGLRPSIEAIHQHFLDHSCQWKRL